MMLPIWFARRNERKFILTARSQRQAYEIISMNMRSISVYMYVCMCVCLRAYIWYVCTWSGPESAIVSQYQTPFTHPILEKRKNSTLLICFRRACTCIGICSSSPAILLYFALYRHVTDASLEVRKKKYIYIKIVQSVLTTTSASFLSTITFPIYSDFFCFICFLIELFEGLS